MKRRAFTSLLGGAAAAWPLVARAHIEFLDPTSHDTYAERLRAFRQETGS